jgi:hypothetical protein
MERVTELFGPSARKRRVFCDQEKGIINTDYIGVVKGDYLITVGYNHFAKTYSVFLNLKMVRYMSDEESLIKYLHELLPAC